MAITSYASFVSAVAGLSVTGVTRSLAYMPAKVDTADCPLQYVRLPTGGEGPLTADGSGGWPQLTIEMVIVISPYMQSRNEENFDSTVTLLDNLSTTLRAVGAGEVTQSKLRWRIRSGIELYGDEQYWQLVASIQGNG